MKDERIRQAVIKRRMELARKEPAFSGENVTFEDIKPYVSMYRDDSGKNVNDVLDKDGKSVFKTHDGKEAMRYLSKNFDKLKRDKDKQESESNPELDRIKNLAHYQ